MPETIAQILSRLTDSELIELLPYIRDEEGEKVNLLQLRRILREITEPDPIPLTVIEHDYGTEYKCGSCQMLIAFRPKNIKPFSDEYKRLKQYCSCCGQAVKWE